MDFRISALNITLPIEATNMPLENSTLDRIKTVLLPCFFFLLKFPIPVANIPGQYLSSQNALFTRFYAVFSEVNT